MKNTTLSIAAALIAASSAGFAAELPTYQVAGFPISPVQAQVLERANVHEQVPASAISPQLLNVPPQPKKMAAATATAPTTTSSSVR